MNEDELIHRIAHHMDPLVFEHQGSQPPSSFFGSADWWATARHSRRQRATEAATAALAALQALGLVVVPREATPAMARAGAARLAPPSATAPATEPAATSAAAAAEQCAHAVWQAMLDEAARQDEAARRSAAHRNVAAFPTVIRKEA